MVSCSSPCPKHPMESAVRRGHPRRSALRPRPRAGGAGGAAGPAAARLGEEFFSRQKRRILRDLPWI